MKFTSLAIAAASLLFLSTSSFAADPPTTDWSMETVIVTAQSPGPAFWRLSKGNSEIWILGMIGPMPTKLIWNANRLSEIVDGAHEVLTPAQASANIFEVGWFLLWNRSVLSNPGGKKLEESLPPELKARFVAARSLAKRDADRYEDDPPVVAAMKLENDFNQAAGLTQNALDQVAKIARAKHVKLRNIADYGAMAMVKEFLRLPAAAQQSCLENAVADIETRAVHAVPASEAWALGDLKGIKAHYSPPNVEKCAKLTASFSRFYDRSVADSLAAIDQALSEPGKTVMVVDIGALLRNTGVAEKLKAKGITIEGPAE